MYYFIYLNKIYNEINFSCGFDVNLKYIMEFKTHMFKINYFNSKSFKEKYYDFILLSKKVQKVPNLQIKSINYQLNLHVKSL